MDRETTTFTTSEGAVTVETIIAAQGLTKRYTLGKDNCVDALRGADVSAEYFAACGGKGYNAAKKQNPSKCIEHFDGQVGRRNRPRMILHPRAGCVKSDTAGLGRVRGRGWGDK